MSPPTQASSNDTGQLYAALHHRIQALRSRAEQEQETKSIPAEPEVPQSNEEDSDEDDILAPAGSATASGESLLLLSPAAHAHPLGQGVVFVPPEFAIT